MSKRKAGEESDPSDKEEVVPPNKKAVASGDGNGVVACELSRTRKVVVKKFKGKVFVDIREFWSKDGEDLPSKKGISLPLEQWKMLQDHLKDIQNLVDSLK